MAESKGSLLAKSVQKHAGRAKEKILQNLGKVDRTADEIFDDHINNFNRQQNNANRLQKEFNNYIRCVRSVQTASKSLMEAICDVYEAQWSGADALNAQTSATDVLWQDFSHKLGDQVLIPLNTYTAQFPEMKKKIEKRNRKLIDYDGQRHTFQGLQANAAKRKDDVKLTKGRESLEEARRTFDILNTELHDELPALHDSRILFLVTNLQTLFASEQVFHCETSKVYAELEAIVDKLATDSQRGSYTFKKLSVNSNQSSPPQSPNKPIVNSNTVIVNNNNNNNTNNNNSYPNSITNGSSNANSPSSPPSSPSPHLSPVQTSVPVTPTTPSPPAADKRKLRDSINKIKNNDNDNNNNNNNNNNNENIDNEPSYLNTIVTSTGGIGGVTSLSSSSTPSNTTDINNQKTIQNVNNDTTTSATATTTTTTTTTSSATTTITTNDTITNSSSNNYNNNITSVMANTNAEITTTSKLDKENGTNNNNNNNNINNNNITNNINNNNNNVPKQSEHINGLNNNNNNNKSEDNAVLTSAAATGGNNIYNNMEELYDIPVGATTTDLPPGVLYRVKATYKYVQEDADELSFEVGDIICVTEYDDPEDQEEGWLMGEKEGTNLKGLFPANFTRPL